MLKGTIEIKSSLILKCHFEIQVSLPPTYGHNSKKDKIIVRNYWDVGQVEGKEIHNLNVKKTVHLILGYRMVNSQHGGHI